MDNTQIRVEFRKTILNGGELDGSIHWLDARLTNVLQSAVIGGIEYVKKGFVIQKVSESEHALVFILEANDQARRQADESIEKPTEDDACSVQRESSASSSPI